MRINKNYSTVDLTNEYFKIYTRNEDTTMLQFNNTAIKLDNKSFEELKDQIMLSEELSGSLKMFQRECDKPSKETLLKELMKTIDKVENLVSRYDEKYLELMAQQDILSPDTEIAVRKEIYPLYKEKQEQVAYMEKLKAKLKYGELQ